jgi:Cu+-exporting ATPase
MSFFRRLLGGDEPIQDLVCGMQIPASRTRDFSEYQGQTYHFCSTVCKDQFDRDPERYVSQAVERPK